jgi:two-component system sensor histidine kinase AlgZ
MESGSKIALSLLGRGMARTRSTLRALRGRIEERLFGAAAEDPAAAPDSGFLPDFCQGWTVFSVAVVAEILAIIIVLVSPQIPFAESRLGNLFLVSLFIQWIALTSAAALCGARRFLNRLSKLRAVALAYLMLLCVTWLVGEAALWALWLAGSIGSPQPEWNAYFHVQNLTVAALINAMALRYFIGRHQLRQRTLSEARAKVQALRSRIRPHFLFNTMNTIAALTRSAPAQAETAIENMADLVRIMLTDDENLVPVGNEIAIARKYLAIESLRLDNRLAVDWDVGKFPRKAVLPVLTLQPLLEHAIQCGVEPAPEGGRITVRLWEADERIHIEVTHPLPRPRRGARTPVPEADETALDNLRQRLETHYGTAAVLETNDEAGRLKVAVTLPTRGEEP